MNPVTGLAPLAGQILTSVHMGHFRSASELRFQPGYCSHGKFQLGYRDEQGVILQVLSR